MDEKAIAVLVYALFFVGAVCGEWVFFMVQARLPDRVTFIFVSKINRYLVHFFIGIVIRLVLNINAFIV